MRAFCGLLMLLLGLTVSGGVASHPLAPALLQLTESTPAQYEVLWRTSVARVQRVDVQPVLPADCIARAPAQTRVADNERLELRWRVQCKSGGMHGATISVAGLERSRINVILRIEMQTGEIITSLLDAAQPQFVMPAPAQAEPVFAKYLHLGIEHLLLGIDHVLFVIGLVLLVRPLRPLLLTITAFTLGHSLTLSLASLGLVVVNAAWMELGIALSILLLAVELARTRGASLSLLGRHPAWMAAGFGLLHGLGFAGALAEIGLPQGEIPLALLAFNLGIEAGQILLIAGLLLIASVWKKIAQGSSLVGPLVGFRTVPVYVIGALSAFWCFERAELLLS